MNDNLKKARKRTGLTQVVVAKQANITEVSYQRIEYGKQKPSLLTAQLIAIALSCTVEELFPVNYLLEQTVNKKKPDCNQAEKRN